MYLRYTYTMQIDTLYVNLFFYTHLLVMELNTENCI